MAYTQTNSPSTVNTIALAENITSELDLALEHKAVTGIFSDNGLKPKYLGHGIVILRELEMSALGDYNRDTGFSGGSISIKNVPYKLSQERGREFQIDSEDADESGIGGLSGVVMREFMRTKVIPEVDAYTLSKLVGLANDNGGVENVAFDPNTIFRKIREHMAAVQDVAGYDEELVCFIDSAVNSALETSTELTRRLELTDFTRGDVTTKVKSYNGMPFLPVPSSRMKSAYTFYDGETTGEEDGGFIPAPNAKSVGFIILPKRAACLVKKTEKTRIFSPSQNLKADAYKMDYRLYYDVFVKNSMLKTVRAMTY